MDQVTTIEAFTVTLKRDLLVAYKRKNDIFNPFMFFLIVCSLFPIGISPDPARLGEIASGVLWISALLASLLAMDSLYRNDFEDGSLEQLLLSPHPLYFLVLAKNMAHWLVSGLPVVIVSPLVAYMLSLPGRRLRGDVFNIVVRDPDIEFAGLNWSCSNCGSWK